MRKLLIQIKVVPCWWWWEFHEYFSCWSEIFMSLNLCEYFFIFLWMFHWRFTVQLITICRSILFHIEFMTSFIHWILFLLFHDTWDTWIVQTLPPSRSIPQHLIMRLPTSERHVLLFPRDFNVCHSSLVRAIAWMKLESTVT